jgi:hypothetical protein
LEKRPSTPQQSSHSTPPDTSSQRAPSFQGHQLRVLQGSTNAAPGVTQSTPPPPVNNANQRNSRNTGRGLR